VAAASAPVLAVLPQDPALAWFAPDAVSALLTAGHVEQARAWLGLAESEAEPGTVAGEASSRLWALGLLVTLTICFALLADFLLLPPLLMALDRRKQ